jgi:hypothetical protein
LIDQLWLIYKAATIACVKSLILPGPVLCSLQCIDAEIIICHQAEVRVTSAPDGFAVPNALNDEKGVSRVVRRSRYRSVRG